jgi:SAM-dependent methyltransferase
VTKGSQVHPSILGHYNTGIERDRFSAHAGTRLEFARSKAVLDDALPDVGRVLDIGGGPGRYADWLVERGLTVGLFDVIPLHVEQASELAAGRFSAELADARAVPRPDAYADVVLLLGPLYHLVDGEDRLLALAEAFRLLRPGGLLIAAAIGRLAWFLDATRSNLIGEPAVRDSVRSTVATGLSSKTPGPDAFYAYFHRPDELRDEICFAGFLDVSIIAVEGLGYLLGDLDDRLDKAERRAPLLELLQDLQEEPGSVEASPHLLALARKPQDEPAPAR